MSDQGGVPSSCAVWKWWYPLTHVSLVLGALTFRGLGASEAEDFIRAVNRIAFAANKSQDPHWKAELASTAFSGDALHWFRSLSPKLQSDWDALRNVLLQRYAPQEEGLLKDYSDKDSDR